MKYQFSQSKTSTYLSSVGSAYGSQNDPYGLDRGFGGFAATASAAPTAYASSGVRIASLVWSLLQLCLLCVATQLSWWDFAIDVSPSSGNAHHGSHVFGHFSLGYFSQCEDSHSILPPWCEVYAVGDLARAGPPLASELDVVRKVLLTDTPRGLLIASIVVCVALVFAAAAPYGWGEHSETNTISNAFAGNAVMLKLISVGHAFSALLLLGSLGVYLSSTVSVDQLLFFSTFYSGLTSQDISSDFASAFVIGQGRQMVIAACVFSALGAIGYGALAVLYSRRGFAAPEGSVVTRWLPRRFADMCDRCRGR